MDSSHERPENLREVEGSRSLPPIPKNIALAAAVILAVSGILVAVILPELTVGSGKVDDSDTTREGLTILLASSVNGMTIGDVEYENLPVPTAVQIMMRDGDPENDLPVLDQEIRSMLDFIYTNMSGIDLKVLHGSGWVNDPEPISIQMGNFEGRPGKEWTVEVPVGLGDKEMTLVFELKLWEVEIQ